MNPAVPYQVFPLGDTALTIDFGNRIDEEINKEVLRRFAFLQEHPMPGIIEIVPAYSSLTLYYDFPTLRKCIPKDKLVFDWVKERAEQILNQPLEHTTLETRTITIPVCYDELFAPDIKELAAQKNLTVEQVICFHSSRTYRVYMLGFLPGFPYMGEVDERIVLPRKQQPSMTAAGSVGIAGRQTGIYPLAAPAGWQIIGRTPLRLFDCSKEDPVPLRPGDTVRFISISKDEFAHY